MKKMIFVLVFCLSLTAGNVFALVAPGVQTYTYDDTWVNWPGYTSDLGDENGTPKIEEMEVTVAGGYLQSVNIVLASDSYQYYDSLFISTDGAWDSWDYFVHSGGSTNIANTAGDVAADGLYSVDPNFDYTYVINYNRVDNPNGIDADSLTLLYAPDTEFTDPDGDFGLYYSVTHANESVFYDFSNAGIEIDETSFFVAYAPWCDNDVIGGGTAPVPEPATMVLLGSGLVGLAFYRRRMKK